MEIRRRHAGYVCRGKLCRGCHHRQKSLPTTWWTSHRNQPLQIHIVTHLKSKKMRESDHLILIASGKIWAKATHIWLVSMSGDNAANTAKVQGFALLPSDKAHGATKNISDNASAVSRDCRSKALASAPHLTPPQCSPPLPLLHSQAHEKATMRTAREPMRTAAERKDCPKGRA